MELGGGEPRKRFKKLMRSKANTSYLEVMIYALAGRGGAAECSDDPKAASTSNYAARSF